MTDDGVESRRRLFEERYAELAALAGGLAHEIKNPLSTLNLAASMAERVAFPRAW